VDEDRDPRSATVGRRCTTEKEWGQEPTPEVHRTL